MPKPLNYTWLDDNSYAKLKFRTSSIVRGSLEYVRGKHGLAPYIDGAVKTIMEAIEQSWMVVRGKDIPFDVEITRYFDGWEDE